MTKQTKRTRIEKFTNALGEIRYRFVVPSILHPGQDSRSLNCWKTYSGAYKALKQNLTGAAR